MSLAKKCDRCGKFYKHYPDGNKWQWNAIRKFQRNIAGEIVAKCDLITDLCPECMDEFEKFMAAKSQEEEKMLKIEKQLSGYCS